MMIQTKQECSMLAIQGKMMAMIPKYAKMNKNPESSDKDTDNYFDNKLERIKTKNKRYL